MSADPTAAYDRLRAAWTARGGLALPERAAALQQLRRAVLQRAEAFVAALDTDFGGRSRGETLLAEVASVLRAIDHALPRLKRWSRPERIAVGWPFWPARARLQRQPLGVVAILGPSNFPVQLTLLPLVGALAAGCRVIVKPSELTPATAQLLAEVVAEVFDPDVVAVVQGDGAIAAAISRLPLDHLLFTGSTANGRKVMAAAAEQLTPVTLELGGKSPVIVAPDAAIEEAAQKIIAGKLMNGGQTCVAPDYVLVPRASRDRFVAAAVVAARRLYPDPDGSGYTAVRDPAARVRLATMVQGLDSHPLFATEVAAPRVAPCLVLDPPLDHAIMQDEIFGPLLPVLSYDRPEDALAIVNRLPRPLALYWFGRPGTPAFEAALARTLSGAVAVNETVLHAAVEALPFGGVGASGQGAYHGRAGFETFSHRRPIFIQSRWSLTRLLQPPYGARAERIIRSMLR